MHSVLYGSTRSQPCIRYLLITLTVWTRQWHPVDMGVKLVNEEKGILQKNRGPREITIGIDLMILVEGKPESSTLLQSPMQANRLRRVLDRLSSG